MPNLQVIIVTDKHNDNKLAVSKESNKHNCIGIIDATNELLTSRLAASNKPNVAKSCAGFQKQIEDAVKAFLASDKKETVINSNTCGCHPCNCLDGEPCSCQSNGHGVTVHLERISIYKPPYAVG